MMQFNCFSLNSIGPTVELVTGPRRFLAVYFTSAVAGVCLFVLVTCFGNSCGGDRRLGLMLILGP